MSLNNLIYVAGGLTKAVYCYDPVEDYWMHVQNTFSRQVIAQSPNRNEEEIRDMIIYLNFTVQIFRNFLNSLLQNCLFFFKCFVCLFFCGAGALGPGPRDPV